MERKINLIIFSTAFAIVTIDGLFLFSLGMLPFLALLILDYTQKLILPMSIRAIILIAVSLIAGILILLGGLDLLLLGLIVGFMFYMADTIVLLKYIRKWKG